MSLQFHQARQTALGGRFDFAAVLAQLGRNPGQAQRLVDAGFGLGGHQRIVFHAEQAVLAELQPHLDRARADRHVVVLAAGEILHGGAETVRRQRAHVHLQTFAPHLGAGLVLAVAQHLLDARIRDEAVERGRGLRAGDQQVQVAHGFAAAPQAAGGRDGLHAGDLRSRSAAISAATPSA